MAKKQKQKLGPLQREWVRALRSGDFKQTQGILVCVPHNANSGDVLPCCCLGVACLVAEANGVPLKFEEMGGCLNVWSGQERCTTSPPSAVVDLLRLTDTAGSFEAGHNLDGCVSLMGANDHGKTFKQIADFVEGHPEAVFTEPA